MTSEKSPTPTKDDVPEINPEAGHGCPSVNGHISQIPGLSPAVRGLRGDRARGRRVGVLDGDSEYVKLAKQGGHKGLLWHNPSQALSSPRSYQAPAWFSVEEGCGSPSLISGEHKRSPRAFQRSEPPFGGDNMSAWERDDSSGGGAENHSVPEVEVDKLPAQSQKLERSKFRRIVFDKKPAPVDMTTLLSFGYMGDSKPSA